VYLKKPLSDIQYAAPSTSTAAFLPINPQLVPTCSKANVKGVPTKRMVNKAVSVQTYNAFLPSLAPMIRDPAASLCVPALFSAVGVYSLIFS